MLKKITFMFCKTDITLAHFLVLKIPLPKRKKTKSDTTLGPASDSRGCGQWTSRVLMLLTSMSTFSYHPQGQIQAQEGEGVGLLRPCHPRLCEAFNINFGSFVQHLALSPKGNNAKGI